MEIEKDKIRCPSPDSYNVPRKHGYSPQFTLHERTQILSYKAQIPGPIYEIPSTIKNGAVHLSGKVISSQIQETPGPASYNVQFQKSEQSTNLRSRMAIKDKALSPSPDRYEIRNYTVAKNQSNKISLKSRVEIPKDKLITEYLYEPKLGQPTKINLASRSKIADNERSPSPANYLPTEPKFYNSGIKLKSRVDGQTDKYTKGQDYIYSPEYQQTKTQARRSALASRTRPLFDLVVHDSLYNIPTTLSPSKSSTLKGKCKVDENTCSPGPAAYMVERVKSPKIQLKSRTNTVNTSIKCVPAPNTFQLPSTLQQQNIKLKSRVPEQINLSSPPPGSYDFVESFKYTQKSQPQSQLGGRPKLPNFDGQGASPAAYTMPSGLNRRAQTFGIRTKGNIVK